MDVFDLYAKIALDKSEYESGIKDAKGSMSNLAKNVGDGLKTVAKVGAAAVTAAAAGVAALTKMSVEGYAQYEQLAGGAKLMFGDAWSYIEQQSKDAYKNVQMSQNDYLQQVNGFAVGLKTALGGNAQAAAELADRIITAEADIVAATGNSQEMVQNAFNGIMKGNFTMVDNLGLGVTATKEGFQTMIDSVNAYNEAHGKSTNYQIENIADCQSALLDYVEMQGMSGYAGMEAAKSIEGSVSMMKAAWQNLVVGMADENANMEVLINNFVESTVTAAKNLMPRIEQTLVGIGQLITSLAPVIAKALPKLITAVLPSLLSAGVSLVVAIVDGVITALPALYDALLDAVQIILVEVFGVSEKKAGEFADGINSFFTSIKNGFGALVKSAQTDGTFLNAVWTEIKETAQIFGDFLSALWDAVSTAFSWCVEQISTEGTFLNTTLSAIWDSIQSRVSMAVDIIQGVISVFTAILRGDWEGAWDAVLNITQTIFDAVSEKVNSGLEFLKSICPPGLQSLMDSFSSAWNWIVEAIGNCIDNIKLDGDFLNGVWLWLQGAAQTMGNVLAVIWDGISTAFNWCVENIDTAGSWLNSIWTNIQNVFEMVQTALGIAFEAVSSAFAYAVENINTEGTWANKIFTGIQETVRILGDFFDAAWTSITNIFAGCVEQITTEGSWLNETWDKIQKVVETLSVFVIDAWNAILSNFTWVVEQINTQGTWLNDLWVSIQNALQVLSDFFGDIWDWVVETFTKIVGDINTEGTKLNSIFTGVQDVIQSVSEFITSLFDTVSSAFSWCVEQINTEGTWLNKIWEDMKEKVSFVWENIQIVISGIIDNIKGYFTAFTQILKGDWEGAWNTIKETVTGRFNDCKELISNTLDTIKKNVTDKLGDVKKKFTDIWDGCKKIVSDAVSALKNSLNFSWSLPKLKIPHISVSGGKAPYGIGGEGHLPHFSISWYKKAYDNAMVLSKPTIFGFSGTNFLGGGDGPGNEIVAGESHLMNLIGQVVESKTAGQNERIIALLSALLSATVDGNNEMVSAIMTDKNFSVGEREFARLVRTYA